MWMDGYEIFDQIFKKFHRIKLGAFNTLKPWQHGWHFADNILKLISLFENICSQRSNQQ